MYFTKSEIAIILPNQDNALVFFQNERASVFTKGVHVYTKSQPKGILQTQKSYVMVKSGSTGILQKYDS